MGFCRITGYSLAEVLYKNCRFLQGSCSDQESRVQLRAAINAGRACVVQLMNFRKNGDPFVNLLSITPIHDANGTLTHYVGIQSDITELVNHRKAELAARHAALQAAAATEAKSQFLARMSHEIRTPLNGMIAVGQLLAETSLSPAQWDLVNTIRCSGETLLTLITDILDFSRIEANKLVLTAAVFSLQTVVEAAMEIAGLRAAQKRLQMAYHISSGIPRLLCGDAQRLQQVLLNVLNNAVKFTESGEILLEIWAEPPVTPGSASPVTPSASLVTQSSAQDSGSGVTSDARGSSGSGVAPGGPEEWPTRLIRFSVKDTGIGISAPDLGKLFKSFSQVDASVTRSYGGSGLGLVISKRLAEAMGGRMWAESAIDWPILVDASVTRSYGGSGLGLVISKRLAEAMGGRMWAESAGPGHGSTFSWSIAVKFPQGGRNSTVNTAAKSRRSSVLLSAAKQQRQQQQQQQHNSGSDGSGLRGDLNLAGVLGLAPGFSNPGGGGFCQDSDETCSVVSSDAGTFGSERETISLLSLPAGHKLHRAAAAAAANSSAAAAAALTPQGSANLAAAVDASTPLAAAAGAAAAGGFAGLSSSPAVHSPLTHSLLLQQQQQQQQQQFGGPYSSAAAAAAAAPGEAAMPLLRGKRVLLVEPCRVVRSVLALALRSWGCFVCAVPCEAAAMQQLVLNGTLHVSPGSAAAILAEAEAAAAGSSSSSSSSGVLQLEHAPDMDERTFCCSGPYDCVLLDMHHTRLLSALTLCEDREAARLVFMGWPVLQLEEHWRPGSRQLGYVTVTRPLRQGRLKLALEEVLVMSLDPVAPDSPHGSSSSIGGGMKQQGCGLDAVAGGSKTAALRVLLAEDNAINMKVATGILARIGVQQVAQAVNGAEALAAVEARGGGDAFDVLLIDLHMPLMGGMECVSCFKQRYPHSRSVLVAVTADAFEDTRDRCLEAGFDAWLAKPFRVEDLVKVISDSQARLQQSSGSSSGAAAGAWKQ
ncbi:hypothetical protein OEZ85_013489 [Tetradesmus obliquus]|nr:hypothetical protein OEZ85_013489 [Tetradesmus obliquus]